MKTYHFAYSYVSYDARGRDELVRVTAPLEADNEESAVTEAVQMRDKLIQRASEEREKRKTKPVHGIESYHDMHPINPRVIREISLET